MRNWQHWCQAYSSSVGGTCCIAHITLRFLTTVNVHWWLVQSLKMGWGHACDNILRYRCHIRQMIGTLVFLQIGTTEIFCNLYVHWHFFPVCRWSSPGWSWTRTARRSWSVRLSLALMERRRANTRRRLLRRCRSKNVLLLSINCIKGPHVVCVIQWCTQLSAIFSVTSDLTCQYFQISNQIKVTSWRVSYFSRFGNAGMWSNTVPKHAGTLKWAVPNKSETD